MENNNLNMPECGNGINVDTTASPDTTHGSIGAADTEPNEFFCNYSNSSYRSYPGLGFHTIYLLEANLSGSSFCIFFGNGFGGLAADLDM